MGEFAKKLHRKLAAKAHTLPTEEPERRPGELLPGGIKDVATLIKEGLDPIHAAYVFMQNFTSYFAEGVFVKRDLRRLPQTGDVWEAGFLPLPRKRGRSQEWLGVVVSRKSKLPLATRFCETTPTVNDLAVLLSSAMRRPSIEVEERQRPERIYLHDDPHWAELVPHLEQLGIQVSKTERLALCEKEAAELIGSVAGRSPEGHKKAAKHS